ncbi:MAG: hypothetical protein KME47_03985 [Nodosilinea sp. WJT8-NPBG4]|nr:hypothetical protein [Nodosilinea sp. WJT8-NPBG4]
MQQLNWGVVTRRSPPDAAHGSILYFGMFPRLQPLPIPPRSIVATSIKSFLVSIEEFSKWLDNGVLAYWGWA